MFGVLGIPSLGPWELIAILAVVLIIFGPGKLPDVGKSLGKTIREFRNAQNTTTDQRDAVQEPEPEKKK
jgi:sec-independent protein translocase protein TatA